MEENKAPKNHKHIVEASLLSKHFHLQRVLLILYVAIISGLIFGTIGYFIGISQGLTHNQYTPTSSTQNNTVFPSTIAQVSMTPSTSTFSLVVSNSGSTNMRGWSLTVNGDGSGMLISGPMQHQYPQGTFNITRLQQLLTNVPDASKITPPGGSCVKSVSFGSSTSFTYKGETSGDISCVFQGSPYYQIATAILNMSQIVNSTVSLKRIQ